MCRDVSINVMNGILDEIHNKGSEERIKGKCNYFLERCDYEELKLTEAEIRKDRLIEFIKFFNICNICEYDIFDSRHTFYGLLERNLEPAVWTKINEFISKGNILCDFQFD